MHYIIKWMTIWCISCAYTLSSLQLPLILWHIVHNQYSFGIMHPLSMLYAFPYFKETCSCIIFFPFLLLFIIFWGLEFGACSCGHGQCCSDTDYRLTVFVLSSTFISGKHSPIIKSLLSVLLFFFFSFYYLFLLEFWAGPCGYKWCHSKFTWRIAAFIIRPEGAWTTQIRIWIQAGIFHFPLGWAWLRFLTTHVQGPSDITFKTDYAISLYEN